MRTTDSEKEKMPQGVTNELEMSNVDETFEKQSHQYALQTEKQPKIKKPLQNTNVHPSHPLGGRPLPDQ